MTFEDKVRDAIDEARYAFGSAYSVDKKRVGDILLLANVFNKFVDDVDGGKKTAMLDAYVDGGGDLVIEIEDYTIGTVHTDLFTAVCESADRLEFEVHDEEFVQLRIVFANILSQNK